MTKRCGRCKSVYWDGLFHSCVSDELHPVLSIDHGIKSTEHFSAFKVRRAPGRHTIYNADILKADE